MSRLDDRERTVLLAHYGLKSGLNSGLNSGLDCSLDSKTSRVETKADSTSYEQIASTLGLSIQRIRQIERKALDKLRAFANS